MSRRNIVPYNPKLKERSRSLRKNMTDAERRLWSRLRRKQINGFQFYRQRPIGNYIADFYCPDAKMVIEVDGGQHFLNEGKEYDAYRDQYLMDSGLTLLRFSNLDVLKNIDSVMQTIFEKCMLKSP
jgi:very-short-patch-repair endonuclease